jgi:threonine/homoserine/homoserine lactone efflux protein
MFGFDPSMIVFIVLFCVLYFVPAVIAKRRRHRKHEAIFVLNLLFGWTFIGWAAAAVWAYTEDNRTEK